MNGLFDKVISLNIPSQIEVEGCLHKARIIKHKQPQCTEAVSLSTFTRRSVNGFEFESEDYGNVIVLPKKTTADFQDYSILLVPDFSSENDLAERSFRGEIEWLMPRPKKPAGMPINEAKMICERVRSSWTDAFTFTQEIRNDTGGIIQPGLRPPQLGAIHATLAHWSVTDRPATIVMPTGTGKTETMLALLTATKIERLMVVVPNAALRDQIASKFASLGILKKAKVLAQSAETPVVAILEGRPTSADEVIDIFSRANVIVTTMQVVGQCDPEIQAKMAELCSHLFIDEAHHIGARTWFEFRGQFDQRQVVQFTATPFRTDGRRVDGKFIYVYPLAKAQREGYFRPINFQAIQGLEESEADSEIIRRVGAQLRVDLSAGYDHLAMARVSSIDRAINLHKLYEDELAEFNPVLIHSRMKINDRKGTLTLLHKRQSRIIVCVDMLGEGFDLPQLKISGIHDRHKSVAITLQFTGRFTRDSENIGNATVFANIEQTDVDDALRSLYAEDADWNFLLNVLSETKTSRLLKRSELMEGFRDSLEGIPLQTLIPKMSTVVYKTNCEEWRPQDIESVLALGTIQAGPIINEERRVAIFVTREEASVRWSTIKELNDVQWNLFIVHWDVETKLLYINSSKNKELHEKLAKAVCGDNATRILGEPVYRVLDGMNRLMLMNLGLSSLLGRHIRYTMFVGSDITAQISDGQLSAKRKSNLFGVGYKGEGKRTIGCSAKGKFWSMQSAADFSEWLDWCQEVGAKVTDETIGTDAFLRNLVQQKQISERPSDKPVLAIHWPETFLVDLEERISLKFGDGEEIGFFECEIEAYDHEPNAPIRFRVTSENNSATFEVRLSETGATYPQIDGSPVRLNWGSERLLSEVFSEDPPHIYFADGDFLIFNELFSIPRDESRQAYNSSRIETWNWDGTDLFVESQGLEKLENSIQYKVIQKLLAAEPRYLVIFDDDGKGEIADVVALREHDDCLHVDLFHLKYSHGAQPGNRVADLYEVCGQAQKSIRWMEYPVRILKRIRKRENDRRQAGLPSRFECGDLKNIRNYLSRWKTMDRRYRVWIVQPGLKKSTVEPKQLDLLAATENFLLETYSAKLYVVGSE